MNCARLVWKMSKVTFWWLDLDDASSVGSYRHKISLSCRLTQSMRQTTVIVL